MYSLRVGFFFQSAMFIYYISLYSIHTFFWPATPPRAFKIETVLTLTRRSGILCLFTASQYTMSFVRYSGYSEKKAHRSEWVAGFRQPFWKGQMTAEFLQATLQCGAMIGNCSISLLNLRSMWTCFVMVVVKEHEWHAATEHL